MKGAGVGCEDGLRGDLIPAIWATIRLLEPLLDTVVAEDMLAVGQTKRGFVDTLRVGDTELIVADDTGSLALVEGADIDALELADGFPGRYTLVGELAPNDLLRADA